MEPLVLCSILLLLLFQGKFTLLRDARTDGSFLVHHFLSFYLRGTRAAGLCEARALSSPGPWSFPPRALILLEQRLVLQSTWRPWISTRRQDLWIPVPACSWDVLHSLGRLGLAP